MNKPRLIRIAFPLLLFLTLLFGTAYWATHRIKASTGYNPEARFAQMPADDSALESWLKKQPGVVEHTVHITRENDRLEISCIMSQDLLGNPPFPNLDQQSTTLGYTPKEKWHEAPRH